MMCVNIIFPFFVMLFCVDEPQSTIKDQKTPNMTHDTDNVLFVIQIFSSVFNSMQCDARVYTFCLKKVVTLLVVLKFFSSSYLKSMYKQFFV